MTCQEVTDLMQRELDRDLDELERKRLSAHLQQCPDCAEMFEKLKRLSAELEQLPKVVPPVSLVDAILPRLAEIDRMVAEGEKLPRAADSANFSPARRIGRKRFFKRGSFAVAGGIAAAGIVLGLFMLQSDFGQFKVADDSKMMNQSAANTQNQSAGKRMAPTSEEKTGDGPGDREAANFGGERKSDRELKDISGGNGLNAPGGPPTAAAPRSGAVPPTAAGQAPDAAKSSEAKQSPNESAAKQREGTAVPSGPGDSGGKRNNGIQSFSAGEDAAKQPSAEAMQPPARKSGNSSSGESGSAQQLPQQTTQQSSQSSSPDAVQGQNNEPGPNQDNDSGTYQFHTFGLVPAGPSNEPSDAHAAAEGQPRSLAAPAPMHPVQQLVSPNGKYTAVVERQKVLIRQNDKIVFISRTQWADTVNLKLVRWENENKLLYDADAADSGSVKHMRIDLETGTETEVVN